jgi:hypothetical protein
MIDLYLLCLVENALVIVKAMRMKVVDLRPENPEK